MILVISPAKTLDFTPVPDAPASTHALARETALLSKTTRRLKRGDLKRLMGISDKLAELNVERFKAFDPKSEEGVQAAFAFNGDVYLGLKARTLDEGALAWTQDHLRILSGFYGLLRPLDRIQPYRLEMGIRLKTRRGEDLYDFWGPQIAKALGAEAKGQADPTVVNLASQEYARAIQPKALKAPLINIHFKEEKDGQLRVLGFFAKKARGLMARYAAEHRLERAEDLKAFDVEGYRFRPELSKPKDWVFSRPQP